MKEKTTAKGHLAAFLIGYLALWIAAPRSLTVKSGIGMLPTLAGLWISEHKWNVGKAGKIFIPEP